MSNVTPGLYAAVSAALAVPYDAAEDMLSRGVPLKAITAVLERLSGDADAEDAPDSDQRPTRVNAHHHVEVPRVATH